MAKSKQFGDIEPADVIQKVLDYQEEAFNQRMRKHEEIKLDRFPLSNPVAAKGTPEHEAGKKKFRELILKAFPNIYDKPLSTR